MKKKSFAITCLLLTISNLGFSQIETYDLSKFKLPTLTSHRLNFGLELDNTNSFLNYSSSDGPNDNRQRFSGAGGAMGEYNNFYNSEKVQSTSRITSLFNIDKLSNIREVENQGTYFENENGLLTNFGLSNSTNYYLSGKTFLFISPTLLYQIEDEQQKDEFKNTAGITQGDFESRIKYKYLTASTNLGIGFGRIELISDAQMALYILNDLKEENRLIRDPSHDEITRLAELMAIIKSESILDSRHRLIEEVKAIDSLLSNLGLANVTDAAYFTTIYDNWQYSNNPNRYSGYSLSVGPSIGYYSHIYSNKIESSENQYNSYNPNYGIRANASFTKPINHKWQRSYATGIGITKINSRYLYDPIPETEESTINSEIIGQIAFGYYPNSRTFISYSLSSLYNLHTAKQDAFEIEDVDFQINSGVDGYYYLSPQLRMAFNVALIFSHNKYSQITPSGFTDTINQINFGGSVGINYFIF